MSDIERLKEELARRFGIHRSTVRVVIAPYRICPLGAHVDHQLGPVTAIALDRSVTLAYAPFAGREMRLQSLAYPGEVHFSFDDVPEKREGDWGNFPRGAVNALQQNGPLRQGLIGLTAGGIAEGGLSSSAAVGVAYLLALEDVNDLEVSTRENIALDQFIENEYLGLQNGILDQSAILLSKKNALTVIDCAKIEYEHIPQPDSMPDFVVLVAFSGVKQALVRTDYNRRVAECAEAARALLEAAGRRNVRPLLGNIRREEYDEYHSRLEGASARRAAHFFSEVERVHQGIEAWREGDLDTFGRLMTLSGESSIRNYECGSPPLIDLYEILVDTPGVYGTRFSGAGFRGCCIALACPDSAEEAAKSVRAAYAKKQPALAKDTPVLICSPDDGARIV